MLAEYTIEKIEKCIRLVSAALSASSPFIDLLEEYKDELKEPDCEELLEKGQDLYDSFVKQEAMFDIWKKFIWKEENQGRLETEARIELMKKLDEVYAKSEFLFRRIKMVVHQRLPTNKACFVNTGWGAITTVGMVYALFEDKEKQMDPRLDKEAQAVVDEVLRTKQPPFGGWM